MIKKLDKIEKIALTAFVASGIAIGAGYVIKNEPTKEVALYYLIASAAFMAGYETEKEINHRNKI